MPVLSMPHHMREVRAKGNAVSSALEEERAVLELAVSFFCLPLIVWQASHLSCQCHLNASFLSTELRRI